MPRSPMSVEQLRDYAYCSMLYYWRHVAGIRGEKAPRTTLELAGDSVRDAWSLYASRPGTGLPDLVCLGKALTGGFPLSACVGRADLMDAAWPVSTGEAIHTSTYLGHPVGCAMALAQIAEIKRLKLCERSARRGAELQKHILHRARKGCLIPGRMVPVGIKAG